MWVADLDATITEIRSHGVKVSDPEQVGPGRQAFLRDPSGNLIELNEPAS
jgi:predicted enzyme related to lactoylglutathione lyase